MTKQPRWVKRQALLVLHDESLARFGGASGLRDEGMLDSALSRPENKWHYEPETGVHQLAAAYCFGLAKNHPFVDGNKRVAFAAMVVFLAINGVRLVADPVEAAETVLRVASGEMDEDLLAEWLVARCIAKAAS